MRSSTFLTTLILTLTANIPICGEIGGGITTREEFEKFAESWMEEKLPANHIPGAVLVIVKDGAPLFAKGYGVAELESQRPMDPDKTVLRVASISKLFTATAVMQALEKDLVDMNTDIRTYIEPDLMSYYPTPVNLHQLLTHSAGVGDKFVGQTFKNAHDLLQHRVYLEEQLAKPLAPPGYIVNYSNHGISLAAHVVERVTGLNFEEYCRNNIFGPLEMADSTFIPSDDLMGDAATGYKHIFGGYRVLPLRHWRPYPASSLVTTGSDIGRFMMAHLNDGSLQSPGADLAEIFSEKTAKIMHRRQFTMHPRISGMAYGFWERVENGQRLLWHSGHMPGHRTGLFLIPSEKLGIFIYNNTEFRLFDQFIEDFLDQFYPAEAKNPILNRGSDDLSRYAGAYRHNWYPRRTFGKIVAFHGIQGQQLNVKPSRHNRSLLIDGKEYQRVVANLFKSDDDDKYAAFWETPEGKPVMLYQGGMLTYHRLRWYQRVEIHYVLSILGSLTFVISFCAWIRMIRKTGISINRNAASSIGVVRLSAGLICVFYFTFLIGFAVLVSAGAYEMIQEIHLSLKIMLAMPLLACAASAVLFITLPVTWNIPQLSSNEKVLYSVILVNSLVVAWILNYWNLLGYRF